MRFNWSQLGEDFRLAFELALYAVFCGAIAVWLGGAIGFVIWRATGLDYSNWFTGIIFFAPLVWIRYIRND